MSPSEFDAYLSLLGKLLHLSSRQRELIAAELRDHLEERLQCLLAEGVPRPDALRIAIDELGDGAALANNSHTSHLIRNRRQLMRYSLGSAVVLKDIAIYAAIREFDDQLVGALRLNSLSLVVSEEQAKLLHQAQNSETDLQIVLHPEE